MTALVHSRKPVKSAGPEITPSQADALLNFRLYVEEFGTSPSYDDLAKRLGVSKSAARFSLVRLHKSGYLEETPARYRPYKMSTKGQRVSATLKREAA